MEPRELAERVAGRVERVGRLRAHEAAAVRDDVVHDDDRLLRGVVDRGVVGTRRADVELRRELAVEARLRQDVGTRRPVEVRLHAVRARPAHAVGALDRHPEPHLLRQRLRRVDLLDADDAVAVADVVERLRRATRGRAPRRASSERQVARGGTLPPQRVVVSCSPRPIERSRRRAEHGSRHGGGKSRGRARGMARPRGRRRPRRHRSAPRCSAISAPTSSRSSRPAAIRRGTWGPRRPDAASDEPGGRFLYLNTGKASVVVPDGAGGATRLDELASECDVVVTDRRERSRTGRPRRPSTTVVVITPFGLTGPYAGYRAHHLVTFHAGGEGSILPSGAGWKQFPDRPPIQIGSDIAEYDAGLERGRRGARRLLRPAADRSGPAHRRLGAGVAAHPEPHPPQPVQQRRRHAPPRRQSLRILRDDRVLATVGCSSSGSRPTSGTRSRPRPTRASSPIRGVATTAARAADMAAAAAGAARVVSGARRRPTSCAS